MSNDKITNIGKRILALRREKGLTQDELAACLCITAQAISKWERGVGLPDVTILPALADALGVTVGTLFGEDTIADEAADTSDTFDDMPKVGGSGNIACYSNKEVLSSTENAVTFTDGSIADYSNMTVINKGDGDVRILETENEEDEYFAEAGEKSFEKELHNFDSIDISVAYPCCTNIIVSKNGFEGVKARGSARFISLLSAAVSNDTLCIKATSIKHWSFKENPNKNSLTVYISPNCRKSLNVRLSGSSIININADFDDASLSVSGSGSIKAYNCGVLKSVITGSGCIELANASVSSEISISGSGDLSAKQLGNTVAIKIAGSGSVSADAARNITSVITGSGDVSVKNAQGDLSCKIAGSGDFTCGGAVDNLSINITGSGDFCGEKLTANEANIEITGTGDTTVYRIVKSSIERLSKSASLTVMHRGEEN